MPRSTTSDDGECQAYLTVGFGTSFTVPTDWNNASNTIEVIGGGGGGARGKLDAEAQSGGGGGGYSKIANLSLSGGGSVTIQIGTGGGDSQPSSCCFELADGALGIPRK